MVQSGCELLFMYGDCMTDDEAKGDRERLKSDRPIGGSSESEDIGLELGLGLDMGELLDRGTGRYCDRLLLGPPSHALPHPPSYCLLPFHSLLKLVVHLLLHDIFSSCHMSRSAQWHRKREQSRSFAPIRRPSKGAIFAQRHHSGRWVPVHELDDPIGIGLDRLRDTCLAWPRAIPSLLVGRCDGTCATGLVACDRERPETEVRWKAGNGERS